MRTDKPFLLIGKESASTSSIKRKILHSLRTSKEYRHAFADEAIRSRLTTQVKTMREQRGWDYKQFAEELKKKVSWTYRLEDPNAALPTLPTLLQAAEAFDVVLDVRFRSFSEFLGDVSNLKPSSFEVASFDQDVGLAEKSMQDDMLTRSVTVFDEETEQPPLSAAQDRPPINLVDLKKPKPVSAQQLPQRFAGCAGASG